MSREEGLMATKKAAKKKAGAKIFKPGKGKKK
jgi:hypothetical protein